MSRLLMAELFKDFESRLLNEKLKPPSRAMRMTFGKYLGTPIDQVPRGYLRWVRANISAIEPVLADAIQRAIAKEEVPDDVLVIETGDGWPS